MPVQEKVPIHNYIKHLQIINICNNCQPLQNVARANPKLQYMRRKMETFGRMK